MGIGNGWVVLVSDEDQEFNQFYITPIEYWQKHGFISDSITELPCLEGCLEYNGKHLDPLELLKAAGFREVSWGEKLPDTLESTQFVECSPPPKGYSIDAVILRTAEQIVDGILTEYEVGTSSRFCDEQDWDAASREDLVNLVIKYFEKPLPNER